MGVGIAHLENRVSEAAKKVKNNEVIIIKNLDEIKKLEGILNTRTYKFDKIDSDLVEIKEVIKNIKK